MNEVVQQPEKSPSSTLLDYFGKLVAFHDIQHAHRTSQDSVFSQYITRGLVMPTKATYVSEAHRANTIPLLKYFKSIGIGPREVRYLPGENLFEELARDIQARGGNERLSLFGQSETTQNMFADIAGEHTPRGIYAIKKKVGVPTLRVGGTEGGVFNNKLLLRRVMEERLGMNPEDPASKNVLYATDLPDVPGSVEQIRRILELRGSVIVKPLNQVGGELIKFCTSVDEVRAHIAEARRQKGDDLAFIIEENVRRLNKDPESRPREKSAQFLVEENGKVHFLGVTEQIMEKSPADEAVMHTGNVASGDPHDPVNQISKTDLKDLMSIVEYAAKQWNYRGYVGVDLIQTDLGMKVLEANARVTGATYPMVIIAQIQAKTGKDMSAVTVGSLAPGSDFSLNTFSDLQQALGDLLYPDAGGEGIIPTLITTLPEKVGLTAIGTSSARAKDMLRKAAEKLHDTSNVSSALG